MYCTYEDLTAQASEAVLLQQADMEAFPAAAGEADSITPTICNACAEIDGYLRRRYALPQNPAETPPTLKKYAADISIYHIFSRKGLTLAKESEDSIIAKRYDDAIKYLLLVADGKADIPGLKTLEESGAENNDGSGGSMIPLYRG